MGADTTPEEGMSSRRTATHAPGRGRRYLVRKPATRQVAGPPAEENNGAGRATSAGPSGDSGDALTTAMREHPGHWIAWNEVTKKILAIGDDYAAVMKAVADPQDPNLVVAVAPGIHPAAAGRRLALLKEESPDILDDVRKYWGDAADDWLDSPNAWFDGRKPRELVGTEDEEAVRNLIRAIRTGIPA
jgi:hypothetical protein